jgi:hypothetical protein
LTDTSRLVEAEETLLKSYKLFKKAMEFGKRHKKIANRLSKRCVRLGKPKIPAKVEFFPWSCYHRL